MYLQTDWTSGESVLVVKKCKKSLVKIYHKGHIKYAMYIDRIEAPPSPKPLFKVITLDTK